MKTHSQPLESYATNVPKSEVTKEVGYIRLLSSILEEPLEMVAIALRVKSSVLTALAAENAEAA